MKRAKSVGQPWTCPTCNVALTTPYCPTCGESPLRKHDLTLRGFAGQIILACTSIDGPLLRALRSLITAPGSLTLSYLEGRRKAWTPPLPLFLLANVLFFAMQSLTGAKIFSTPLADHLHSDIWGGIAQTLVDDHLQSRQITLDLYAPIFNKAVELNSKSLIAVMILPFALASGLIFYRRHRPFVAHVVFALHFYAFLLLLLCVSLAIVEFSLLAGGPGLGPGLLDRALSIMELLACGAYLHLAATKVYGSKGLAHMTGVVTLVLAAAAIFLGYRFLLLPITLKTT